MLLNGLKSLRDGLLEHKDDNAAQVFDENGALLQTLRRQTHGGRCVRTGTSTRYSSWFISYSDMEVKRACYACAEGYRADPFFGELVEK